MDEISEGSCRRLEELRRIHSCYPGTPGTTSCSVESILLAPPSSTSSFCHSAGSCGGCSFRRLLGLALWVIRLFRTCWPSHESSVWGQFGNELFIRQSNAKLQVVFGHHWSSGFWHSRFRERLLRALEVLDVLCG